MPGKCEGLRLVTEEASCVLWIYSAPIACGMRAVKVVDSEALAKAARRCIEQLNLIGRGEMREDDDIQEIRRVGESCAMALPLPCGA